MLPFFLLKKPIVIALGFLFFIAPLQAQTPAQTNAETLIKPPPQRIASLNICIDQLLWELVPHERLVSFSYLTANPMWSPIAGKVKGMPLNHGLAEEIVPLHPDIILAGEFDARDAISLLQRLGARVERVALPRTLDDIHQQILQVGELVGVTDKAQQMSARIAQQLNALKI
ncbi:MAG TPA: ABC transporter substrate-binding protein, partial [Cellvibrio sp.]